MAKFCPACEDYRETKTEMVHESFNVRGMKINVPVQKELCAICGEWIGSDEQDQGILDFVNSQYRAKKDLLTPEKIKQIRSQYDLSQKSFALLLGMSEVTINRYENGALQDQAHDTLIRNCEKPENVRELLKRRGNLLNEWQRNRVLKALEGKNSSNSVFLNYCEYNMPDEISDRTGFRHFDYNRFAYLVIYFCKNMGEICKTFINKLLFYSDFLNFKTSTVSLTGAAYRKIQYGPVPANYGVLLSKMEAEDLVEIEEKYFSNGSCGEYFKLGPAAKSIQVELTKNEKNVLDRVIKEFRTSNAKEISERSHKEDAWLNTKDKELISYTEALTLSIKTSE